MLNRLSDVVTLQALRLAHARGELKQALKTVGAYTAGLWRAVRQFYLSEIGAGEFVDRFVYWIDEQLNRAWREGARDVNVKPDEFEQEDLDEIGRIISQEYDHVLDLAGDIETAREAQIGYEGFRSRVDMWANRYNDVVNQARIWFGGREKLKWVLGATEEHCATCNYLNGIVAYAKEWQECGVHPQQPPNPDLECGGWRCGCSLQPTDERKSRNAVQRILAAPKE